ncbi:STAS domain-containing protein [Metabacillus idriensis]|uniref:STAS domain-containing protein n=1 Tax=Metabacillus idriensis TaxID=324768 RepID=UPI001749DDD3|nr:STAS domain-containing protein [Metabacillus idriensis]
MTTILNVSKHLIENAESLAVDVVENVLHSIKAEIPEWEKTQAISMYIDLIGFLGESIIDDKDIVPKDLIEWSKKNGEREAASEGRISEIAVRYPPTRNIFIEIMTRISVEFGLTLEENSFIIKRINSILDISLNETIFAFERLSDKIKEETQREMAELSAPIVPIRDGIAVLPLIGTVDSYRAAYILEKVVPKIAELQTQYLIADFSGIYNIDIEIAYYLYQIENVLSLLGINTIVTGLRPDLAKTVVNGGIDMSSIKTFAHVKQALESID